MRSLKMCPAPVLLLLAALALLVGVAPAHAAELKGTTGGGDSILTCADAGSTDAYACNVTPAPISYVTRTCYFFTANTANTGVATIDFNSLGPKTIKKSAGGITADLLTNEIRAGQQVLVCYDGTNFQMVSASGKPAGGTTGNVLYNTSDAPDGEAAFSYDPTTNTLSVDAVAITGAGSGFTEYVTGACTVSASGTVKVCANTGNVASVSENGAAVEPLLKPTARATDAVAFGSAASTQPAKKGTVAALPASCTQGEVYFATNATAGQNLYYCTATNTWTQQLNSGGGAPTGAQYVTLATDATLTAERVLTPGDWLGLTDAGAGGNATLNLRPSEDLVWWKDDFMFGGTAGHIGEAVWAVTAGTATHVAGVANHPGILQVATTATNGTVTRLIVAGPRNDSTLNTIPNISASVWSMKWVLKVNQVTQHKVRFGMADSVGVDPPANGYYFEVVNVAGAANWFGVTRNANTPTATDTTIAADTGWHLFEIRSDGTNITFHIDGTQRASQSANKPTVNLASAWFQNVNTEAVDKSVDLDYVHFYLTVVR